MTMNFDQKQTALVRDCVQDVTGITLPWEVTAVKTDEGLHVAFDQQSAQIAADSVNSLARGFFLLSRAVREGRQAGEIRQTRHFPSCGAMVDASRNAVMKVDAVKGYIRRLACLGMNLLMLYTEDTFEVPEYPAFGYLRGAYSMAELREIDDYAASLGVELVPCIQTLAHLAQFLQWDAAAHLGDTQDILMIDEPETYAFIEAEIRAISSCVRSRRIHIGMDEAFGVGLGRYYAKHGPQDRYELLSRHLSQVIAICDKYALKPIMWSDMFFTLGSKTGQYFDKEAVIPRHVIDSLPDVALCYWDYYHMDADVYEYMLTRHEQMGKETVFAGGVWTWSGFLPQVKHTEATMSVALKVCARHQVDTVFATMWGDDGAETNVMLAASLLPLFSEACWQGDSCDPSEAVLAGECLTGIPRPVLDAWGDFYPNADDSRPGKLLIWCDPLFPMIPFHPDDSMDKLLARSRAAIQTMQPYQHLLECRYASLLFQVCIHKGEMIHELRDRYLAGDRDWLTALAEERIPALRSLYQQLEQTHRELWERDNKRFGWEVLCLRYGGAVGRLSDVQCQLRRYLAGELDCIEELEAEPMGFFKASNPAIYGKLATPARDYWQLF
ncbi:MAG: beta-N-acetylhexosaminidase [Clostridiales bacterium]|nr:beta-N-acetylhexosaminidase [Clostridiales bacterium]